MSAPPSSIIDVLKPGKSVNVNLQLRANEIIDNNLRSIINEILNAENIATIKNGLIKIRRVLELNNDIQDNDINRIVEESFGPRGSLPSDDRTKFKNILKVIDKFYNLVSELRINQDNRRTLLDKIKVLHVNYSDKFIDAIYDLENLYGALNPILILYELYRTLSFERNGYGHFDDVEWFLVLMSRWASISGKYLPVCPTKRHTSTLRLYIMYRRQDLNSISVSVNDVKDLIEKITGFSS